MNRQFSKLRDQFLSLINGASGIANLVSGAKLRKSDQATG
jgi:hypothetical protein